MNPVGILANDKMKFLSLITFIIINLGSKFELKGENRYESEQSEKGPFNGAGKQD